MEFTTLALLLFCLLVLLKLVLTPPTRAIRLPPGPWQLPLIGSLHHLLLSRFADLPHRALRELSRTHGHGSLMHLRLGSVPTLVVSSAEAAREVMKTQDAAFASRHLSATVDIISCGGQGIVFSLYNDRWRELRKVCVVELFSQSRVLSFRPAREDEVARLIRSVSADCRDGRAMNLSEKMCRMTNDVVVRAAIGTRCDRRHRDDFLRQLDEAVRLTGGNNLADLYPSSRLVRRFSAAARDMDKCQGNIFRIMQSTIRERSSCSLAPERDEDLLGVLQKDGGLQFELTTQIISTVMLDIFGAGSETSSSTLEWAMSELMKNSRAMHRVQSEVREAFKGQDKLRLREEDVAKARARLGYLHLVLKETLRLHPPVVLLLPRECREDCLVMGYDVPKGTKVLVNVWAIGRDDRYWADAEAFRPQRFEYLPFGAGRRMCPGILLGMANMELALASLLFHFDWELPTSQDLDMSETFGITVQALGSRKSHAYALAS